MFNIAWTASLGRRSILRCRAHRGFGRKLASARAWRKALVNPRGVTITRAMRNNGGKWPSRSRRAKEALTRMGQVVIHLSREVTGHLAGSKWHPAISDRKPDSSLHRLHARPVPKNEIPAKEVLCKGF
jgi:hypothetical protein